MRRCCSSSGDKVVQRRDSRLLIAARLTGCLSVCLLALQSQVVPSSLAHAQEDPFSSPPVSRQEAGVPTRSNGPAVFSRAQQRELINDFSNSFDRDTLDHGNTDYPRRDLNSRDLPTGTQSQELKQLRTLLRTFSKDAEELAYTINDQMVQVAGLRDLYTAAMQVSAEAIALDKNAARATDHRQLQRGYQQMDADWRELAYSLQGIRGLSATTQEIIDNLNNGNEKMRKTLNLQPQLNRHNLQVKAGGLATDLNNLLEDITYELGRSREAQQLLMQANRARQQVLNFASLARDDYADGQALAAEYQRYEKMWLTVADGLQREENRAIDEDLRRIARTNGELRKLLLLPQQQGDTQQMGTLAASLQREVNDFMERTPLILVMHLPRADRALSTADQFYHAVEDFVEASKRGHNGNDLIEAFSRLDAAQRQFDEVYGSIDSEKATAAIQRIDRSMASLRTSLQVRGDRFDAHSAADVAASIENLTEQLEFAARNWLAADHQNFANDCLRDAASLHESATRIHEDLIRGAQPSQLRGDIESVYEDWKRVYAYLVKCETEDRAKLARISKNLTPALIELRTMVTHREDDVARRPINRN